MSIREFGLVVATAVGLALAASEAAAGGTSPPHAPEVTLNVSGEVVETAGGVPMKNSIKQRTEYYWTHGACPAKRVCTPTDSCSGQRVCAGGFDHWASCPADAGPTSGADGEQGPCVCWDEGTDRCGGDVDCPVDAEICVDGQCRATDVFDWSRCDQLRFGLGTFDEPKCGGNDTYYNELVDPQEEADDVEDAADQFTHSPRPYCTDSEWRPLDESLLEYQRRATFPAGTSAPESTQYRWWERAHVNLLFVHALPQTADSRPDERARKAILNTCRLLEGRHTAGVDHAVPPIVTYAMVGPRASTAAQRYGGLLAAAGGTGRCCWKETGRLGGCPDDSPNIIDVCEHIREPARTESQLRADLQKGQYRCAYRDGPGQRGSMNWNTKPGMDCHLVGTNAGSRKAPGACGKHSALPGKTDVLGEIACLQSVPRGKTFDEMEFRYCPDGVDDADCSVLGREDVRFIDDNESVFLVADSETCEAIGRGDGTVVQDKCPNVGSSCRTGAEGRCGAGQIVCVDGQEVCKAQFGPMPEICNGLDDDCDGSVDNLASSWSEFRYTPADLPAGYEEVECNQKNFCVCPNGRHDSHVGETFDEYAKGWDGACYCSGT